MKNSSKITENFVKVPNYFRDHCGHFLKVQTNAYVGGKHQQSHGVLFPNKNTLQSLPQKQYWKPQVVKPNHEFNSVNLISFLRPVCERD